MEKKSNATELAERLERIKKLIDQLDRAQDEERRVRAKTDPVQKAIDAADAPVSRKPTAKAADDPQHRKK